MSLSHEPPGNWEKSGQELLLKHLPWESEAAGLEKVRTPRERAKIVPEGRCLSLHHTLPRTAEGSARVKRRDLAG